MGFLVKETLKRLCCGNGWSYGAFWSFDHRNSMLLTMEDIYHEEACGKIASVLQKVHMLGEGIVGEVASTGTSKWIFADANGGGCFPSCSAGSQVISQDDFEVRRQFCYGTQTIAVISVESRGVAQFGSTQKVLEAPEFLSETQRLFKELGSVNGFSSVVNQASPSICESSDLKECFASFCNGSIISMHAESCHELMELDCTAVDPAKEDVYTEKVKPLCLDLSYLTNQWQADSMDASLILASEPGTQFQQLSSTSPYFVNKSSANAPGISTWSNNISILTSSESQWSSLVAVQDSSSGFFTNENSTLGCEYKDQNMQGNSFSSAQSREIDMRRNIPENFGSLKSNHHFVPPVCGTLGAILETETILPICPEEFKLDDFAEDFSDFHLMDNLLDCLSLQADTISEIPSLMSGSQSPLAGVTPASTGLAPDVPFNIPAKQPTNSVQSAITDAYSSGRVQSSAAVDSTEKDLFEGLGLECMFRKAKNSWQETMMPLENDDHLVNSTGISKCTSNMEVSSTVAPQKALFAELGLEELFQGVSNCSYHLKSDDQLSTSKRRKMEPPASVSSNQAPTASVSCSGANTIMQPPHHLKYSMNHLPNGEVPPKSKFGLWIDDGCSINAGSAVPPKPKKLQEPKKVTKKRGRPGEGTRPRPKDRQMILDRLAELKKIIPGGEKFTTDGLLDHTIKHMLFLQSVTKYADKLKQLDERKMLGQQNKICLKDNIRNHSGVTWAMEVDDQSMVCPIIVEDLDPSGLMLIQMLCEDRGLFLEIADVIRDSGLDILRGVTEFQEDKIWAHFIVEAKANITRREVIYFLVKLLERNGTGLVDLKDEPCNTIDDKISLLNNYQQPAFHCPINLTKTLH